MKKILSFILTMGMIMAMGVTAFAGDATVSTGDRSIDVEARYQDNTSEGTVYSVDVSWGAMQFTYAESGAMTWNPEDHTYTDNTTAGWTADGNTITVTNHSNAKVTASFEFAALDAYKTVSGSFDISSKELAAGVVNGFQTADKVTTALTLGGTLPENVTNYTKVGTITVKIN